MIIINPMKFLDAILLVYFLTFGVINYSASQENKFPYTLDKIKDPVILSTGIALELTSWKVEKNIHFLNENEILNLNRKDVFSFDRSATYNWSPKSQHLSDITLHSLKYLPAIIAIPQIKNKQWKNCLTLGIMYIEASYLSKNFTYITKVSVRRKRPYLYNTSISESVRIAFRDNTNSYKSFFSGHTSSTFCAAAFISKTYSDLYGKSTWFWVITGGSFSLAATTGYLRWKGGVHYPSDIIAGAIVGSSIGYLIPILHKKKNSNFEALILPNQFYFCYKL